MKTNKKFMLLSALGIIFVLDDHAGTPLNFFASIFPYNSFYMPMFVFISGYFFKAESCIKLRDYFVRKAKTFLIPYLAYSMIYYVLNMVTNYYNLTQWEIPSLPHFFKVCWTSGTPVSYTHLDVYKRQQLYRQIP